MRNSASFLIILILCLLSPLTIAQQETKSAQSTKTITGKRLKQAKMPAAVIKTFRADAKLSRYVKINGNSIRAAKGYMLVQMKSGVVMVMNDDGKNGTSGVIAFSQSHSDLITTASGWMVEIRICGCGEGQDTCSFGRNQMFIDHNTCAGESCCKLTCFRVDRDGNKIDC